MPTCSSSQNRCINSLKRVEHKNSNPVNIYCVLLIFHRYSQSYENFSISSRARGIFDVGKNLKYSTEFSHPSFYSSFKAILLSESNELSIPINMVIEHSIPRKNSQNNILEELFSDDVDDYNEKGSQNTGECRWRSPSWRRQNKNVNSLLLNLNCVIATARRERGGKFEYQHRSFYCDKVAGINIQLASASDFTFRSRSLSLP